MDDIQQQFLTQFADNDKVMLAVEQYFLDNLDTRITDKDLEVDDMQLTDRIRGNVIAYTKVKKLFREIRKFRSGQERPTQGNSAR